MCVIMCFEDNYPTEAILESAELTNRDGAGIAWIEKDGIHFKKGLDAKNIYKLIKSRKIQLPFIIHFRIATVGGVNNELTHPFPISSNAPLSTSGTTEKVLFHNGHWNDWREWCMKTITRKCIKFPRDIWSDSRALAFLTHHYGYGFLELIENNKIAILDKDGIHKFGTGWAKVGSYECSNNLFDKSDYKYNINKSNYGSCLTVEKSNEFGYWRQGSWNPYNGNSVSLIQKSEEEKGGISLEDYTEKYLKILRIKTEEEAKKHYDKIMVPIKKNLEEINKKWQ